MVDYTGKQLMEMGKVQVAGAASMIKIADRIQGEIDDVKVTERTNKLHEDLDAHLIRYSQLNGAAAWAARPQFEAGVKEIVAKHGGDFDNDVQKLIYQQKAAVFARTGTTSILRHATTEFTKYDLTESKAEITGLVSNMARSWESRGLTDAQGRPAGDYATYQAAALSKLEAYANKVGIPIYESKAPGAASVPQQRPDGENGATAAPVTPPTSADSMQPGRNKTAAFKALEKDLIWEPAAVSVVQSMVVAGQYSAAKTFLEGEWKAGHLDEKTYQSLNDNATTADRSERADTLAKNIQEGKRIVGGVTYAPPLGVMPKVSSGFGHREAPIPGASTFHTGVDYPAREGTPIYASADGTVEKAGTMGNGGNSVILNHGERRTTGYMHMQNFVVKEGDTVKQGQIIGYVGSTGNVTGPHLHFTMTDNKGRKIDPSKVQFGQAIDGGEIQYGPQSPQERQAVIDAIPDPALRKMVQVAYNQRVAQEEAATERLKKQNWHTAMDLAYAGDGNQWMSIQRTNPGLWNSLDATQQATLMQGRPKGDDPETMLKLLKDPLLWQEDKLKDFRSKLSQGTYERFFAQGNGPKAQDNVRAAAFENDMFEATMLRANLPEYVDPKDPEKKRLVISLRDQFRTLIDVEQTAKKGEITRERKQELLDQIIRDKATIPGYLYDSQKPIFTMTDSELKDAVVTTPDGKKVKLSAITGIERKQIVPQLIRLGRPVTEANIAKFWLDQKADAAAK